MMNLLDVKSLRELMMLEPDDCGDMGGDEIEHVFKLVNALGNDLS